MAELYVKYIGGRPVEYRYLAEDWEKMAFFMDDLRGYPTEKEAKEAWQEKIAKLQRGQELWDKAIREECDA